MAQVKIYGTTQFLISHKTQISETIHFCLQEAFGLPENKRFQRFFPLNPADFIYPADRSEKYTIIELSIFEGRTPKAKKQLIKLLFEQFETRLDVTPQDLEITIFETPRHHWGIRGLSGDELTLNYQVDV